MIGDPDTDTDNDFSDPPELSWHSISREHAERSEHMTLSQAMDVIEQSNSQHSSAHDEEINWDDYMQIPELEHPEDDEFPLDRQLRLMREEEEEEEQRAYSSGRLTAPPNEVRRRAKRMPTHQTTQDVAAELREKQMELVNEQLKLQKLLIQNAEIAQKEAKERLKMVAAQRQCAEIELQLKQSQLNARDE